MKDIVTYFFTGPKIISKIYLIVKCPFLYSSVLQGIFQTNPKFYSIFKIDSNEMPSAMVKKIFIYALMKFYIVFYC